MRYISKRDYKDLHKDYKGVYSTDALFTKYNGRRTMVVGFPNSKSGGTALLIEGEHFEIVEVIDDEHEIDCEICYGEGTTEHDVSCYSDSSPQSEYRECEECNGSGTKMIDYEGF